MSSDSSVIDHFIDVALGISEPTPDELENRGMRRADFGATVAFVQWTPTGGMSIPTIVKAKNISATGICLVSRYMLHVGHEGAVLMERPGGKPVILGVKVVHSRYVGDMLHESGVRFVAMKEQLEMDDFADEEGKMPDLKAAA